MSEFAHLQTGIGTSTGSSVYFGPFDRKEAEAFVEKAREEFGKLRKVSPMVISLVDKVPTGRGALPPEVFQGFMQI